MGNRDTADGNMISNRAHSSRSLLNNTIDI